MNEATIKELEQKRTELLKQADAIATVIGMYQKETPPPVPPKAPVTTPPATPTALPVASPPLPVAIPQVRELFPKPTPPPGSFTLPTHATVIEKILAIIRHKGRFLYRKEIIDLAAHYGCPFTGAITSALSMAQSNPKSDIALYRYQKNAGVWGLRQWLQNGEMLPTREYVENEEYRKR